MTELTVALLHQKRIQSLTDYSIKMSELNTKSNFYQWSNTIILYLTHFPQHRSETTLVKYSSLQIASIILHVMLG